MTGDPDLEHLALRPSDVAELLQVSVKTVGRWRRAGELPHARTLGEHARYLAADILEVRNALAATTGRPPMTAGELLAWVAERRARERAARSAAARRGRGYDTAR